MRYSASEKYEIIRLVEQSSLSVKQTLARLDIHRSTFYAWLRRYEFGGIDALEDRKPVPRSAWNKLPEDEQAAIVDLALEKPALSPREIAVTYTDEKERFVSDARSSVGVGTTYRQFSMTTPGLFSPGACVQPWRPAMSQIRWTTHCALRV